MKCNIKKIIYLGDILISYGDFFDRAHSLVPAGYCPEWWAKEFEKAIVTLFGGFDYEKAASLSDLDRQSIERLLKEPIKTKISFDNAFKISKVFNIPLHPMHTFYFHTMTKESVLQLLNFLEKSKIVEENGI